MADRFPLILNTSANQIQEIASGDSLDLTGTNIANAGIITAGNVTIGAATTDLIVNGNARVTGILTVGTGSLTLNGPNNLVNVGTALTLGHTQGLQFHTQNLHSAGFEVNQINVSGASTIGGNLDANGDLDVDGHTNLDNVSIAGVTTIATNTTIGGNLTVNGTNTILNTTTYVQGGENADGILAIYADEGDDNADKWRLRSATNGLFHIDNYANGAWQTNLRASSTSTQLYSAGYTKLNTTTNGIDIYNGESGGTTTINVTKGSGDAEVVCQRTGGSGIKLRGSHPYSYLETTTDSNLIIRRNTDTRISLGSNGNTVYGNTTFTGNVQVGGVLTYEDVTNVDSVGIVTARNGLRVTGGTSNFSGTSHFVGIARFNETIVGTARTAIKLTCQDESTDTTTYPLFVAATTGDQFPKTGTNLSFNSANGTLSATTFSGSGASLTNLNLVTDSSPQLGGDLDTNSYEILLDDNHAVKWGNSTELEIRHTGSSGYAIAHNAVGNFLLDTTGNFYVRNTNGSKTSILADPAGATTLYNDNTPRLATSGTGISVTGNIMQTGSLNVNDSQYLYIGNSGDLRLHHDQANTINYINSQNGVLRIQQGASTKIQTRSTGIAVYDTLSIGTSGLQASNVFSIVGNTQNQVNIADGSNSSWGLLLTQSQAGGGYHTTTNSSVNKPCAVVNVNADALNFGTSNTMRWTIDHDGHFYPGGNGNLDIGKSNQRVRNLYTSDLHLSNEAKGGNSIDNTWGDYTIQEGESDLFLINNRNGKKYKFNLTEVS